MESNAQLLLPLHLQLRNSVKWPLGSAPRVAQSRNRLALPAPDRVSPRSLSSQKSGNNALLREVDITAQSITKVRRVQSRLTLVAALLALSRAPASEHGVLPPISLESSASRSPASKVCMAVSRLRHATESRSTALVPRSTAPALSIPLKQRAKTGSENSLCAEPLGLVQTPTSHASGLRPF